MKPFHTNRNYGYPWQQRTCEVCLARIPYGRGPKTTTCDNVCTKALHRGTTREIEVERETMRAGDFGAMAIEEEIGAMYGRSRNFAQQKLLS